MKAKVRAAKIDQVMTFRKMTPGTYVYEEEERGTPIRVVYIAKSHFPNGAPEKINLRVEAL